MVYFGAVALAEVPVSVEAAAVVVISDDSRSGGGILRGVTWSTRWRGKSQGGMETTQTLSECVCLDVSEVGSWLGYSSPQVKG